MYFEQVTMSLVRSTSDHIAWIFLDEENTNVGVSKEEELSYAEVLAVHFIEVKDYVSAYVAPEDIVVVIPSLGNNIQFKILR
jgi:hypothetical protein